MNIKKNNIYLPISLNFECNHNQYFKFIFHILLFFVVKNCLLKLYFAIQKGATKVEILNTSNSWIILLQLGLHKEFVKTRSIVAGHSSLCICN